MNRSFKKYAISFKDFDVSKISFGNPKPLPGRGSYANVLYTNEDGVVAFLRLMTPHVRMVRGISADDLRDPSHPFQNETVGSNLNESENPPSQNETVGGGVFEFFDELDTIYTAIKKHIYENPTVLLEHKIKTKPTLEVNGIISPYDANDGHIHLSFIVKFLYGW